ncbi:MAG: SDR family oxidoreductase [Actinomycetota bacterium]
MTVDVSLIGKTAVITGASSGIGQAIAERLGSAGAFVYLAGRTTQPMEESRARIEEGGGKAEVAAIDVRDADALRALIERAAEDTGRLDVMVNNAGLGHPGSIIDAESEKWQEMLDVNVMALLVGSQAAIRAMRRAGHGGHIINISSVAATRRDSGVYGATKHAVNVITETLRVELENDDIRITSVMPGVIATNFARNMDPEVVKGIGALAGLDLDLAPGERLPDEALEKAQAALENFIGKPEDIADAVVYLVSLPLRLNIPEIVVRPAKQLEF